MKPSVNGHGRFGHCPREVIAQRRLLQQRRSDQARHVRRQQEREPTMIRMMKLEQTAVLSLNNLGVESRPLDRNHVLDRSGIRDFPRYQWTCGDDDGAMSSSLAMNHPSSGEIQRMG